MKKGKTEIIVLLDRSGSMASIKSDVEGGFKEFIEEQKKLDGECAVTLCQFDTEYETVWENRDLHSIEKLNLTPRGGTALFDAMGKTIDDVGYRLKNTPEKDRPERILFIVVTDGEENSSRKETSSSVKKRVNHQTNKYNWKFIFMGANQDAVLAGENIGLNKGSSITFSANSSGVKSSFNILRGATAYYRTADTYNQSTSYVFSEEERKEALGDVVSTTTTRSSKKTTTTKS